MKIGVTVSESRKFPVGELASGNEYTPILPGELAEKSIGNQMIYLWNNATDELIGAIDTNRFNPSYVHIARQGKDERLVDICQKKGIELSFANGVFSQSIAEFTIGSLYMLSKGLHMSARKQDWAKHVQKPLKGSSALVIGRGSIGLAVEDIARANGIDVLFADRTMMHDIWVKTLSPPKKQELLRMNHVICCLPSTIKTRHILNRDFFSLFRNVNFVNISRGDVLIEDDLLASLNVGFVSDAVLDATEFEPLPARSPLYTNPHIVISAHQSYRSPDWEHRLHQSFNDRLRQITNKFD